MTKNEIKMAEMEVKAGWQTALHFQELAKTSGLIDQYKKAKHAAARARGMTHMAYIILQETAGVDEATDIVESWVREVEKEEGAVLE